MVKKTVQLQAESDDLTIPQDRIEGFLAKAAGLVGTMPEGQFSRLERYLALIAEDGGSASDIEELKQEMQDLFVPKTIGPTPIATFTDGVNGAILGKCVVNIEPVQAGSGDPSPTNVRPISGWTGANIRAAGKNLLELGNSGSSNGISYTVDKQAGTVTANGTAIADSYFVLNYMSFPVDMVLSGCPSGGATNKYGILSGSLNFDTGNGATITDRAINRAVSIIIRGGITVDNLVFRPMIRLATDTDPSFEPYRGNTYTISFGEAGTVYGGTLDVGTGVLTVDKGIIELTENLNYASYTNVAAPNVKMFYSTNITLPQNWPSGVLHGVAGGLASCFTVYRGDFPSFLNNTDNSIQISPTAWSTGKSVIFNVKSLDGDTDAFKDLVTGEKIIYPLNTPITYQLAPTQVRTLLGENHVYADTGDITMEYRGDIPNLYKLIE